MAKSIGSEKFRKLPVTAAKKSLVLSVTLPTISRWETGQRAPLPDVREKIWNEWQPIAPLPEEWDLELEPREPPPPPREPAEPMPPVAATPATVAAEADELLREARAMRQELAACGDVTERARLLETLSRVMASLGRLTGVGLEVSQRQILSSPHWRSALRVITSALAPWPDAMLAVAAALETAYSSDVPETATAAKTD